MSILVQTKVWQGRWKPHHLIVMLALADHADDDGENVYPAVEHVAWKTGYDERSVRRIMGELRDMKALVPRGVMPHGNVRYLVDPSVAEAKPPYVRKARGRPTKYGAEEMGGQSDRDLFEAEKPLTPVPKTPDTGDRKPLTPATKTPDTGDTQNTIETPLETPEGNTSALALAAPPLFTLVSPMEATYRAVVRCWDGEEPIPAPFDVYDEFIVAWQDYASARNNPPKGAKKHPPLTRVAARRTLAWMRKAVDRYGERVAVDSCTDAISIAVERGYRGVIEDQMHEIAAKRCVEPSNGVMGAPQDMETRHHDRIQRARERANGGA